MKYKLAFALAASITSIAFGSMPTVLPEFKNEKQLAGWRAEQTAKSSTQTTTQDTAFYTGKPYVESSGNYAFKYRSYNPEMARWTSEDPSGFRDGANLSAYAPTPTTGIDFAGLWKVKMTTYGNGDGVTVPGDTKQFYWENIVGGLKVHGGLTSDTAPNVEAASINLTGLSTSTYPGMTAYTIRQAYEIKVSDSGTLYVTSSGHAQQAAGGLAIAIGGKATNVEPGLLTLEYNISGAYLASGISAGSASVLGFGGGFSWTTSGHNLGGVITVEFKAVE